MPETHAGPKRKWFYRMAAFAVLGVAVADKRTWKELKPLVSNGLKAEWQAKVTEIMASKGVTATPKPAPVPAAPTTSAAPVRPAPVKRTAKAATIGSTSAPVTPDAIKAQLAAASVAAAKQVDIGVSEPSAPILFKSASAPAWCEVLMPMFVEW